MKRRQSSFRFLGFVALADTLFAVSAGLLLLNPVQFDLKPARVTKPNILRQDAAVVQSLWGEVQVLEEKLDRIEVNGQVIRQRAITVLENE